MYVFCLHLACWKDDRTAALKPQYEHKQGMLDISSPRVATADNNVWTNTTVWHREQAKPEDCLLRRRSFRSLACA